MKFDLCSTKNQNVTVQLISLNTRLTAWSNGISLSEVKTIKTNIHFGNSLSGSYLLRISSTENVITRNVIIQ